MNCDQVFDVLTRGPFPTGTPCDVGVEAHLNICPECRRLAEALRPALELFQEAVGPEESRDLPGYWCAAAGDGKQPGVSYAQDTETRQLSAPRIWVQPQPAKSWSALTAWRMAAMIALGVTVGSLLGSRGSLDGIRGLPAIAVHTADADEATPLVAGQNRDGEIRLTTVQRKSLAGMADACYRGSPPDAPRIDVSGGLLLAKADLAKLNCCSACHNIHSDAATSRSTLAVSQSCQVCHRE